MECYSSIPCRNDVSAGTSLAKLFELAAKLTALVNHAKAQPLVCTVATNKEQTESSHYCKQEKGNPRMTMGCLLQYVLSCWHGTHPTAEQHAACPQVHVARDITALCWAPVQDLWTAQPAGAPSGLSDRSVPDQTCHLDMWVLLSVATRRLGCAPIVRVNLLCRAPFR